jgi:glycosyltransferase involved in cell wall biosynthesis
MPNVLLEASACELPIVATSVGANTELILNEITGFLVPPKDSSLLAKAMLKMTLLPEEKRAKMGLAGRKLIQEKYSLEHIASTWEELYRKLLKEKK